MYMCIYIYIYIYIAPRTAQNRRRTAPRTAPKGLEESGNSHMGGLLSWQFTILDKCLVFMFVANNTWILKGYLDFLKNKQHWVFEQHT